MAGKRHFEFDFCKKESQFPNLVSRIYRKYIRYSFVSRVYYGSTMVGSGEKFLSEGSQKTGKRYFETGFCKYNKCSGGSRRESDRGSTLQFWALWVWWAWLA